MRSLLRKFPEINDKILLDKITTEECFNTNDIFKIYELDEKYGKIPAKVSPDGSGLSSTQNETMGDFDFSMEDDDKDNSKGLENEAAENQANTSKTKSSSSKKRRESKAMNNTWKAPAESFYADMNQFEDRSEISVEDVNLATQADPDQSG